MWFKNLSIFRLLEPLVLDRMHMEGCLHQQVHRACSALESFSLGWIPPLGSQHGALSHFSENRVLFTLQREDKVLPASTIRDHLQERVEKLYEAEGRVVGRKVREALREEVLQDLLPKAFSQKQKISGYIDLDKAWLVVDTQSAKKAEDFVSLLRKSLGSFAVKPFATQTQPALVMTEWVRTGELPPMFSLEAECELKTIEKTGSVIRCQRQELVSLELKSHLDAGKHVDKLGLSFDDRLGFVLGDDWVFRKLKFLDLMQEEAATSRDSSDEVQFDADFTLMSREINRMIEFLQTSFGGAPSDHKNI